MRWILGGFLLAIAVPAHAQLINPPVVKAGNVDLSSYATKAEVQTATTGLASQSALDAVAAAIPAPASTVPGMEVVGGAAGSTMTFRRGDAVQPRITRTVTFTTTSGGTASVTWVAMPSVPLVFPFANIASGATQGSLCYPVSGTITTTGATIKCFTTQSVTVSILGAVVAPITTAAAGVTGQVLAIPAS